VAVLLRQAVEADLPVLYEYQREPLAVAMAAFPARERDAFMAHWRTNVLGDPSTLTRVMVVDGQVVGYLLTWNGDGRRLLGYWVGERFWGRGIASQALALFVAEHELRRPLCAFVVLHNLASMRVLEKNGFVRVGEPAAGHDGIHEQLFELTR
jgi:RimJ/RimL family protein N-acetyltransferase